MRALWLLAALWTGTALAEDLVILSVADIYPLMPPPGAKHWDPAPVVAAVQASPTAFTPKDVYALVDAEVHPEVIKAVAARAALFYDPKWRPLAAQAADARRGQPATTVTVDEKNFVELFEFFNDAKNEITAAEARVGALGTRRDDESQSMFERRSRAHQEALVKARGPFEGRIEATTFSVSLPATVVERDGCKRSVASIPLEAVSFDLFRTGMGTRAASNPVTLVGTPTVDSAQFTTESPRRFEAVGRCGTTGTRLRMTLKRTWDGQWSGSGGF